MCSLRRHTVTVSLVTVTGGTWPNMTIGNRNFMWIPLLQPAT